MKKLLATLLILCAGPVSAEWVHYGSSPEGAVFYDPSTVKGKTIKRVWLKIELPNNNEIGWRSYRTLNEVDCTNERLRDIAAAAFSEPNLAGLAIDAVTFPEPKWRYIGPETRDKAIFDLVCGKK